MHKSQSINRKALAKMMAEWDEEYLVYECEDMLDTFTEIIEQSIKDGRTIALDGFGSFQPKVNPEFTTLNLKEGGYITYPSSTTMKFTPAVSMQKRIKSYTKEKTDDTSSN